MAAVERQSFDVVKAAVPGLQDNVFGKVVVTGCPCDNIPPHDDSVILARFLKYRRRAVVLYLE